MYTIIEDCSPYYIRFTHPGTMNIIDRCRTIADSTKYIFPFIHHRLKRKLGNEILNMTPISTQFELDQTRVSLFVTQPGYYYRAHKDGLVNHVGFNYTIKILDDKCITSWYSDKDLKDYSIDNVFIKTSREAKGFDKTQHRPIKTMTASPNEVVLFNTEIWHDFDNSNSKNERIVLTLRLQRPEEFYFEDVRKIMFGF